ncbi:RNA polymerase II-associated protein 3 [Carica papaya]|uniref:RNA polymerase II-associated protein 3 n=1 Tax=Carica papaya TaxID=3649 RepID=UPI000B8C9EB8|nr:RNA polymerase II-associated protein 3 [Carica papaya]
MARVPSKHGRDQALEFQGFLNDLQDWELSLKGKDKNLKRHAPDKDKLPAEKHKSIGKATVAESSRSNSGQYDYLRYNDALSRISSCGSEESLPDATSEKELGNEYFKQKKFNEAIDCYSRSIALSPTAVAYANRAMAYLKIRRFEEAEDDCTEALNLDDRYVKAYSRRAVARKELGKLKASMEDSEFAMRLEPNNQELKKQHADVKSLYEKDILKKASGAMRSPAQGAQKTRIPEATVSQNGAHSISKDERAAVKAVHPKENEGQASGKASLHIEEVENKNIRRGSRSEGLPAGATQSSSPMDAKQDHNMRKQRLNASVQELASRAASRAKAEAARNITPPNTAYQFENSWRGFSGDRALQAQLLKVTSPTALPKIFKNALTASMLVDIIKCISTFFREEMDLAIRYIENLTEVPRFNMLIMCLSSADRADLLRIWDEVLCDDATPIEYAEILDNLRPKYCVGH